MDKTKENKEINEVKETKETKEIKETKGIYTKISGIIEFAGFCTSRYDVVRRHRLTIKADEMTKEALKGTAEDGNDRIYLTSNKPLVFKLKNEKGGFDFVSPNVIKKLGAGSVVSVICRRNEKGYLVPVAVAIKVYVERDTNNPFDDFEDLD